MKKKIIRVKFRKKYRAFTLLELLVVIAIVGVLAAAVWVAIDPVEKIYAAADSKVQADLGAIAHTQEVYAISHNGNYAVSQEDLVASGELKHIVSPPLNYPAYVFETPDSCTISGTDNCGEIVICGDQKSDKLLINDSVPNQAVKIYSSILGKICEADIATSSCEDSESTLSVTTSCYVRTRTPPPASPYF